MKQSKAINAFIFILLASITTQPIRAMDNDFDSEKTISLIIATAVVSIGGGICLGRFLKKHISSYCNDYSSVKSVNGLIEKIDLSGSSDIVCKKARLASDCELCLSGHGDIKIHLIDQDLINRIKIKLIGSGDIRI